MGGGGGKRKVKNGKKKEDREKIKGTLKLTGYKLYKIGKNKGTKGAS
jgi:hypothetical protein